MKNKGDTTMLTTINTHTGKPFELKLCISFQQYPMGTSLNMLEHKYVI